MFDTTISLYILLAFLYNHIFLSTLHSWSNWIAILVTHIVKSPVYKEITSEKLAIFPWVVWLDRKVLGVVQGKVKFTWVWCLNCGLLTWFLIDNRHIYVKYNRKNVSEPLLYPYSWHLMQWAYVVIWNDNSSDLLWLIRWNGHVFGNWVLVKSYCEDLVSHFLWVVSSERRMEG